LVAGAGDGLPRGLEERLRSVPTVAIGPRASALPYQPRVAIDTGVAGIHEAGIAYRMDDIPLPVKAPLAGPRSAEATLRALLTRIGAAAGAVR
jgi:formylmethanofuran dehydrogenase subunit B